MEWLPRLLLLLLLVDVRGEMLRMEVTVDGGIEALEFDRCASEFELIGLAHTFVHRSGSTLSAVAMPGGVVKSHSELVVDEMRRLQAEATYYSRDACPPRSAPADELPPIWNWGDLRNVARRSDGPRVLLNFGGGIANDMHAFDERYAGWVAVEGPSDPDGYSYGFCADRGQKRGPSSTYLQLECLAIVRFEERIHSLRTPKRDDHSYKDSSKRAESDREGSIRS